MPFARSGRSIFPLLPPYAAHDPRGSAQPLHPDGITPYLGLRSRLSQVWINRWTILLLLVLVRTLMAVSSLNSDMASAKREALSACTSVESMGSAMASMPHYMSQGVNELTASGVEKAVNGLMSMLTLTVTGVEELVVFFINTMTSTYLCLITLAVRGSTEVALSLIKDASNFLNKTLPEIGGDIHSTINTFQSSLNSFIKDINSVTSALGADKQIPTLDVNGSLDKLDHLQLPSSIDDDINKINSSLPNFKQVQNFTDNVIRLPFEELKKLINESMVQYKFDRSVFPVPAKEQLSFCNDNDGINGFFDGVGDIVTLARKIFIAVLVIAAVLACIPMAWREIRRWRSMKDLSQLVRKDAHDPMDVVYIVSRPYTSTAGIKSASRFSNSRRQILVRWVFAYATSTPALFVLSLGIAGLFSCLCQYILLRTVEKTVPELTDQVGVFADKVVNSLNNASEQWAIGANKAIEGTNNDINKDVFGWVNTSTTALNDTLNAFVDETTKVLNETFGGTLLYDPIKEVFNCLIGLKIEGIQKGLDWVSENARVDFPLMPNDTFSLGAAASIASDNSNPGDSFLADPGDQTSNKISEAVVRVVDKLAEGIRTEAIISGVIVLIWVLILLIGIIRALTLWWSRDRTRGEGAGLTYNHTHNNPNNDGNGPPDANGFTDVPLTAVPTVSQGVAVSSHDSDEEHYPDEKVGFAGQRNYDTALKVDHNGGAIRESSYVEYGEKF
ncbi:plasma membrane fusion protein prm1 [Paecilomyces lecythidis]|uniref:Plasma membrane fusion protein PRM1 n=1 Tax=Paecilomyces lecythidis TaxID=3004212 RepID=A0ABR3Y7C7_9EURO